MRIKLRPMFEKHDIKMRSYSAQAPGWVGRDYDIAISISIRSAPGGDW
ncbi:hypothetical protein [Vulcanisaeta distributa]|nr:hypothetical protein [Vulcanisaeta distributa]